MSTTIYKITRHIAVVISLCISIFYIMEGDFFRSLMNFLLLICFLYFSVNFQRKFNLISPSYIFVFIILFGVNSAASCYYTYERILTLAKTGFQDWGDEDFYIIYFVVTILSYLVIGIYLKYFCKSYYVDSVEISPTKGNGIYVGMLLGIVLFHFSGMVDLLIGVLSALIIITALEKRNKGVNVILCILAIFVYSNIFLSRFQFVQIFLPLIIAFLIKTKLNKRKIHIGTMYLLIIAFLFGVGIYGTISEVYKLNVVYHNNYDLQAILTSPQHIFYFFERQLYRVITIWIKLGGYIIYHVRNHGYYFGLSYIKAFSGILGLPYISLPRISAAYNYSTYAQPGLLAEGYANFGIIGAVLNIVSVFFLMEFCRIRFIRKKDISSLMYMVIPFTKILLDGGTFNSAVAMLIGVAIVNVSNLLTSSQKHYRSLIS